MTLNQPCHARVNGAVADLPPHDEKLEQLCLAALLLGADCSDPRTLDRVRRLTISLFYRQDSRTICRALLRMARDGKPITSATLVQSLTASGHLEDAGGLASVASLPDLAVSVEAFDLHFSSVMDLAQRRELLKMANEARRVAHDLTIDPSLAVADFAGMAQRIVSRDDDLAAIPWDTLLARSIPRRTCSDTDSSNGAKA